MEVVCDRRRTFALVVAIFGFSLGRLTEDPWRLLVWLLPLASGFAAAAFVGSVFVKARNFIPGIAVTATGGFAVWLITFFYLFFAEQSFLGRKPVAAGIVFNT